MICFDANVVIAYLNGAVPVVVERVERAMLGSDVGLSSIALFELRYGVTKSARKRFNAKRLDLFLRLPISVLPFEPQDAEDAGDIRAGLERAGTPIGPYDILIAAQARRRGALLVTANTREFARVPGLKIADWTLP